MTYRSVNVLFDLAFPMVSGSTASVISTITLAGACTVIFHAVLSGIIGAGVGLLFGWFMKRSFLKWLDRQFPQTESKDKTNKKSPQL